MKEYMDSIRRRVCLLCNNHLISHFVGNEREIMRCGLPLDRVCAIERYLSRIVQVVESIDSPRLQDYIIKLRNQICTKCESLENGYCPRWLKNECALDRNFMLVVEAIKDVRPHSRSMAN